ncbi:hypothetical protein ABZX97_16280 [Streptomyces seoulensis]|uniref:hypothetical protein n=1 Tax=Streptomyces seoulensis TaxID=73044 RepID=UPI0033B7D568
MNNRGIAAAAVMCAMLPLAGLATAPTAYAESGRGGCASFSNIDNLPDDNHVIIWKSCLSKKSKGVGHPSAIVSMGKKHAKCSILIRVVTTGERIVSKKTYACPTGRVVNKSYAGQDFHGKGQFTTFVQIKGISSQGNLSPRSPWLNL